MTTIDGIPVYRVLVDDENDGMVRVSLVDDPAVMSDFVAFDAQKPAQLFAVESDEKRLVFGVVARADFPIFRKDDRLGEHYVIFPADSIREMAQKYLTEGRADKVDEMHDGSDVGGVHLVQWFIKDSAKGVNPEGFEDIADGSLFAEYKVDDDDIWAQIKAGTFKGFSMEVFYTLTPEEDLPYVEEAVEDAAGMFERIIDAISNPKNMNKKNLLMKLKGLLASFATVTTDKGVIAWDGDEDLKAGDRVYIEDAEGERTPAADGDYTTEDGKVIVIVDGAVSEIRDPEAEVSPAAEDFGSKATDKGDIYWEGEDDLKEGDRVYVRDEEGNLSDAPDGEYRTEDAKVITVVDGVVASITDGEAEVAPEPEAGPSEEMRAELDNLRAMVESLTVENAELKAQVDKLSRIPLVAHTRKGVTTQSNFTAGKTGVKGLDNLSRFIKK